MGQIESVQKLPSPGFSFCFAHAVKRRTETQIVETGEFRIQVAFVWNHADEVLCCPRVRRAVNAADANPSRIWVRQAGEHVDSRGLTGTIGAKIAE